MVVVALLSVYLVESVYVVSVDLVVNCIHSFPSATSWVFCLIGGFELTL